MHKPLRKGARVKLIDSDLSGIIVSDNNDGSVNMETDDGLIIPVKLSHILISDSDAVLSMRQVTGKGKKDIGILRGTKNIKSNPPAKGKSGEDMDIAVVDLHLKIKPVVKNGPAVADILEIQLSKFSMALRRAVAEHKKELIVIHGEGSGKLKEEVRKLSKSLFPQYSVMDAPLHKYGSGASRILLK